MSKCPKCGHADCIDPYGYTCLTYQLVDLRRQLAMTKKVFEVNDELLTEAQAENKRLRELMGTDQHPAGYSSWYEAEKDMRQKYLDLQAIVDKLPKTKDGVVPSEGMKVWFPWKAEYDPGLADGVACFRISAEDGFHPVSQAYSTRAAAEAARDKP